MAKKKPQSKKHKFKHTEPVAQATVTESAAASPRPAVPAARPSGIRPAPVVAGHDFTYVGQDLRRIVVFAAGLVLLEGVLWYLMAHTGLGAAVYQFIKV